MPRKTQGPNSPTRYGQSAGVEAPGQEGQAEARPQEVEAEALPRKVDIESTRQEVNAETLRQEVMALRQLVARVAEANTIENVIMNGFSELVTQLQPLRDLTPRRTPLKDSGNETLRALHTALARPTWTGSKFEIEPLVEIPQSYRPRSIGS